MSFYLLYSSFIDLGPKPRWTFAIVFSLAWGWVVLVVQGQCLDLAACQPWSPLGTNSSQGSKRLVQKLVTNGNDEDMLGFTVIHRRPRKTRKHLAKVIIDLSTRHVTNALVRGHLEPTHLKSSPLFTFSTKSLGQDSPSIHFFSKVIGSRFTTAKIKLGEDSPSWSVFSTSKFAFK